MPIALSLLLPSIKPLIRHEICERETARPACKQRGGNQPRSTEIRKKSPPFQHISYRSFLPPCPWGRPCRCFCRSPSFRVAMSEDLKKGGAPACKQRERKSAQIDRDPKEKSSISTGNVPQRPLSMLMAL